MNVARPRYGGSGRHEGATGVFAAGRPSIGPHGHGTTTMQLGIANPTEQLATMRRAYRDLDGEITAERAGRVIDFVFLTEMQRRQKQLKGEMARVYALTPDGAL